MSVPPWFEGRVSLGNLLTLLTLLAGGVIFVSDLRQADALANQRIATLEQSGVDQWARIKELTDAMDARMEKVSAAMDARATRDDAAVKRALESMAKEQASTSQRLVEVATKLDMILGQQQNPERKR